MKIYIACPFEERERAISLAMTLRSFKHIITARWLTPENPVGDDDPQVRSDRAVGDLRDIQDADLVIVMNPCGYETRGTGGRHTELGIALALGTRVILIGERTQEFHFYPGIVKVEADGTDLIAVVDRIASFLTRAV